MTRIYDCPINRILVTLGLAVVLVSLVGGIASARPGVAGLPPYVVEIGNTISLRLGTDAAWAGAKVVGRQPRSVLAQAGAVFVWAPTCSNGVQTARIRRSVELFAPLASANIRVGLGPKYLTWKPLTAIQVTVNGTPLPLPTDARATLNSMRVAQVYLYNKGSGAAAVRAFKAGENVVEITATKRATPASIGRCGARDPYPMGIAVSITGNFETDLSLVEPAPAATTFATLGAQPRINFSVRNKGTGIAFGGAFKAKICCVLSEETPASVAPFESCTKRVGPNKPYELQLTCTFTQFPPGASVNIPVTIQILDFDKPLPPGDVSVRMVWEIKTGKIGDSDRSNDVRSTTTWFCKSGSTRPGCPR